MTARKTRNIISYVNRDARLSSVLHLLLHLAELGAPATSTELARSLQTNPVVVRRILAGLRNRGYVQSEKGHGGGWKLSCDLATLTLRDVYCALGAPKLLALGNRADTSSCIVEAAVNSVLTDAFESAERLLLERFAKVTLARLHAEVRRQQAKRTRSRGHGMHHPQCVEARNER